MKSLINRHQAATWERGLIRPETNLMDFLDKIEEEYQEMRNECAAMLEDGATELSPGMVHEAVDLIATGINMLTFYGIDFLHEYQKNTEHQERRVHNGTF